MKTTKNIAASIRSRLLNLARESQADFNLTLTRYGLERLLYRLSVSEWSNAFLLKGALLFDLWFDEPHRPTRDIDLLSFSPAGLDHLRTVFRSVCMQACEDGMVFDPASVSVAEIRKNANYEGARVILRGTLDGARLTIQVDVGYGDAVTPVAEKVSFPVLLEDMPQPVLRAYPVYTVVAEKYHAIVTLGAANTPLKDYFDLWTLARHVTIDRTIMDEAIHATFSRRDTRVPNVEPTGLSDAYATDRTKQQQWKAFISKNKLAAPSLEDVVATLQALFGFGSKA